MTKADRLREYALRAARDGHEWGKNDCCTFACDWVFAETGIDPMARWRGAYADEKTGRALLSAYGGLLPMWRLGTIDVGIPECDEPQLGDIGIIEVPTDCGPDSIGAIFSGKRWLMLSERGFISASAIALLHWRI